MCHRPATEGSITYLVTIKNNANVFTSLQEIEDSLNEVKSLTKGGDWSDVMTYERDSLNRLHCHALVTLPTRLWFKRVVSKFKETRPTWILNFKKIDNIYEDYAKLRNYIYKDACNNHEYSQEEYASWLHFNNGFANTTGTDSLSLEELVSK